jgi:GTP cyclohydrolase II
MKARVASMPKAATDNPAESTPIQMVSVADLPTRFGNFRAVAFTADARGDEHIAIVHGHVRDEKDVPMRIHSECLTGDVLGSLRCDCRDQLIHALETLGQMERGVLLYLRQEGRGIGLTNKIRAYALQDNGHDTVEANHLLGFGDDERDYTVAGEMVRALGIKSVQLMTNNPRKLIGMKEHGVTVSGRLPVVMPVNRFNASYLMTKQKRSGHMLSLREPDVAAVLQGQESAPKRTEAQTIDRTTKASPLKPVFDLGGTNGAAAASA